MSAPISMHDDDCPCCRYLEDPSPTFAPADLKYCLDCAARLQFLERHKIGGVIYCQRCADEIDALDDELLSE